MLSLQLSMKMNGTCVTDTHAARKPTFSQWKAQSGSDGCSSTFSHNIVNNMAQYALSSSQRPVGMKLKCFEMRPWNCPICGYEASRKTVWTVAGSCSNQVRGREGTASGFRRIRRTLVVSQREGVAH